MDTNLVSTYISIAVAYQAQITTFEIMLSWLIGPQVTLSKSHEPYMQDKMQINYVISGHNFPTSIPN